MIDRCQVTKHSPVCLYFRSSRTFNRDKMAALFVKDRRKSASLELNEEPPEFELMFLGKCATERKMGRECTSDLVNTLVEQSRGKELKVVKMTITCRGLWVTEGSDPKKQRDTFIPIYSISYGAADKNYPRVFSFVTNFTKNDPNITKGRKSTQPFFCYAFACQTPIIARAMVVYLLRSFKTAYETWKRGIKSQRLRDKIKAGPGHNSFSRTRSSDEKGIADTIAKLNELTGTNQSSDKGSDPSQNGKPATPPGESATRSDKVTSWMDKWLGLGSGKNFKKLSSDESSSTTSESEITTKNDENEAFAEREQEFVNQAAMLNDEVDIVSELQDPEVRSVFEELAETRDGKSAKKAQLLDSL